MRLTGSENAQFLFKPKHWQLSAGGLKLKKMFNVITTIYLKQIKSELSKKHYFKVCKVDAVLNIAIKAHNLTKNEIFINIIDAATYGQLDRISNYLKLNNL